MSASLSKWSFAAGEISPNLWGRPDYAKFQTGASVCRNSFVNFRGGTMSRAGLQFIGQCLQPGTALPPRIIPFRFSITQSYFLEFGEKYIRFVTGGGYVTETAFAITGAGQANPATLTVPGHNFSNGDSIAIAGIAGMIELNGRTFIAANVAVNTLSLTDTFGRQVNSLIYAAYVSGGTAARIYTLVAPFTAADLPYIKFAQSADVMSLCCVNQVTGAEYASCNLTRLASNSWRCDDLSLGSSIAAPATATVVANNTGANPTTYAYVVTAIDAATGTESVASPVAQATNSVNISLTAGSLTLTWAAVAGAAYYIVYKAQPAPYNAAVPIGAMFGFVNIAYGTQWVDNNVQPDFSITPPLHVDPFARGQVSACVKTAVGTLYVQATTTAAMVSATGSGAILTPVVVSGDVVAIIVQNPGSGYLTGDTITIAGAGSGATFTATIGAQSGTYPGVVGYFQDRRAYAYTLNHPDTYFMTQTGGFSDMDAATPPIDSDGIIGSPWAEQVNGIQWLVPMPGGLFVATGLDAWQLSGTGGPGSPFTPSAQNAQPQESNGFSTTVPPVKINYDLLYVEANNAVVRDLQYNFFANIYAGTDISFASDHLLAGLTIKEWAWSRQPYRVMWMVRSDGKFLSLTFLKEQEVSGWARHDTNGLVQSVATGSEPPVDAVYFVVKRYIVGAGQWAYYLERMNNRLWRGAEDPWCLDAALELTQPTPAATLTAASAIGAAQIVSPFVIVGGAGYTAPAAVITDPTGGGSGAEISFTLAAGVITAVTLVSGGTGYGAYQIRIIDATGSGAKIGLSIQRLVQFTASAPVFVAGDVGSVIRLGGGIANVKTFVNTTTLLADLRQIILTTMPNDTNNLPVPAAAGSWSLTPPVSTVYNLDHLEGMQVGILADGNALTPQVVVNGRVTLPSSASAIKVGLPFVAQVQSLHADVPGPETIQGKRKNTVAVTVRLQASRGVSLGANKPVAAALNFQQEIAWEGMEEIKDRTNLTTAGNTLPLFTGDRRVNVRDNWETEDEQANPGMVAAQQVYPLPMNVLAFIQELEVGDV